MQVKKRKWTSAPALLLTGYGPIALVWFDTPLEMTAAQSRELYDLVKALQPGCLNNATCEGEPNLRIDLPVEWQARQDFCVAVDIDRETPAFLPFES